MSIIILVKRKSTLFLINIFITQSPYVENSSRMAAVFLCLQCSYYLLLYHAKIISYISKRMFLTRNTHFDYIYLYTFKTSYRTSVFPSLFNFSLLILSVLGQALKRLVTVSSTCCHASTSALSTSYSSRVFTSLKEWDISSWGGLHA